MQCAMQVNAGDIRLMMPCSKAAAVGRAAAFGQTTTVFDETATTVGDTEPSFLVVILSGFSVSSQAEEQQRSSPRLMRSTTLGRTGASLRLLTLIARRKVVELPAARPGRGFAQCNGLSRRK